MFIPTAEVFPLSSAEVTDSCVFSLIAVPQVLQDFSLREQSKIEIEKAVRTKEWNKLSMKHFKPFLKLHDITSNRCIVMWE